MLIYTQARKKKDEDLVKRTIISGKEESPDEEAQVAREREDLMTPFSGPAELNRHLIHAQETLATAINTTRFMWEDHGKHCPLRTRRGCVGFHATEDGPANGSGPHNAFARTSRSMIGHLSLLTNLKHRAEAFERRLSNEIRYVCQTSVCLHPPLLI